MCVSEIGIVFVFVLLVLSEKRFGNKTGSQHLDSYLVCLPLGKSWKNEGFCREEKKVRINKQTTNKKLKSVE